MDSTVFRVVKNRNYTTVSNIHIFDKSLSLRAKGLLTQMLALPPDWDFTRSGLVTLNPDGKDSVSSGLKELENRGYLFRYQARGERGRLGKNIYYIFENPQENPFIQFKESALSKSEIVVIVEKLEKSAFSPLTENPSAVNPSTVNPSTVNPSTESPVTGYPSTENQTQLNTNKSSTNKTSTNLSITKESKIDMMRYDALKSQIKENVEFDYYLANYPTQIGEIEEIVELIAEMMLTRNDEVIVGKRSYDADLVRDRLSNFNGEHMDYLLRSLKEARPSINNITNYLKTSIINAPASITNEATTTLRSMGVI